MTLTLGVNRDAGVATTEELRQLVYVACAASSAVAAETLVLPLPASNSTAERHFALPRDGFEARAVGQAICAVRQAVAAKNIELTGPSRL